jgi:hypothetical protein
MHEVKHVVGQTGALTSQTPLRSERNIQSSTLGHSGLKKSEGEFPVAKKPAQCFAVHTPKP